MTIAINSKTIWDYTKKAQESYFAAPIIAIVQLFQKIIIIPAEKALFSNLSHYYQKLDQQSFFKTICLIVPFFGLKLLRIYQPSTPIDLNDFNAPNAATSLEAAREFEKRLQERSLTLYESTLSKKKQQRTKEILSITTFNVSIAVRVFDYLDGPYAYDPNTLPVVEKVLSERFSQTRGETNHVQTWKQIRPLANLIQRYVIGESTQKKSKTINGPWMLWKKENKIAYETHAILVKTLRHLGELPKRIPKRNLECTGGYVDAVGYPPNLLKFILLTKEEQNDPKVVLEYVKKDWRIVALLREPTHLKNPEIMQMAIKKDPRAFYFAHRQLKQNEEFLRTLEQWIPRPGESQASKD